MKLKKSPSLSITRTLSPKTKSLSDILAVSTELGPASQLLVTPEQAIESSDLFEEAKQTTSDTHADLAWQAYLNPAAPGGAVVGGDSHVSPTSWSVDSHGVVGAGDRAGASLGGDADGTTIQAGASPFATIPTVEHAIGPEGARGSLGAGLVLGSKVKGGFLDGGLMGTTASAGAVLITDNKIRLLEPPQRGSDGILRQLARFTSVCTPALDLNLSYADGHAGAGVRAVVAFGRATTFEKYVPVDDLAHLLRRRDNVLRPLIETASALCLVAGIRAPSRADLAANMGDIDALRPGESATWLSSRLLTLGVSAGGIGLRAVAQVSTLNSSSFKLKKDKDDSVTLTVRPGKVGGLRLSLEAKVLGDLSVDAIKTAGQERSWDFNLKYMSSRHALSLALHGQLPGYVVPLASHKTGELSAWRTLCLDSAESLPFGVSSVSTGFVTTTSKAASLSSFRLPDFLGGSSLGLSRQGIAAVYGRIEDDKAEVTLRHESSRRIDFLAMGTVQESDSASFTSAVSVGPKGKSINTPTELSVAIKRETLGSGEYGRRRLAKSLEGVALVPVAFHGVQPSTRYSINIVSTMSVDSFAAARNMSAEEIRALAESTNVPFSLLLKTQTLLNRALGDGSETAMAHALEKITQNKHLGLQCLEILSSSAQQNISVVNDAHDQLLTDFLKAETSALGCKTKDHARKSLARTEKLQGKIEKALHELVGDSALHMIDEDEQGRRVKFMQLLRDETAQLAGDIRAALDD